MAATPCPVLVVTASVDGNFGRVYDALGAGALDAVNTPRLDGADGGADGAALLAKIDLLGRLLADSAPVAAPPVAPAGSGGAERWLLAIGASAGGPAALAQLLQAFPAGLPAAIVVIQHLDETFAAGLAEWLGGQIRLPVRLARDGDAPEPGAVLLPGRADHLVLTPAGRLVFTPEPVNRAYRPSVDVFFESVAHHWRGRAAGVILTGMGRDGAAGLKLMRERGFPTIAQDRASSAVYGMPKAAAECGAAAQVLPLAGIAPALHQLLASAPPPHPSRP